MAHHQPKQPKLFFLFTACALLVSCSKERDTASESSGLSLTERLDAGEVRAGVVTDTAALFGGISAEGNIGDIKIYNDRVRFIIEAAGESNYYISYGGGIIDADIVRPFGQHHLDHSPRPSHDSSDSSYDRQGFVQSVYKDVVQNVCKTFVQILYDEKRFITTQIVRRKILFDEKF